jgi:simple sugar transport system ATP-binding protein
MENLLIGMSGRAGRLDLAGGRARLYEIRDNYGLYLEPHRIVATLSVGEQQRLEIIKALFRGARVLILDEPTAVLTPAEVDGLFAALRAMAAKGLGIIFISHKLNEVRTLTHRCVVLRHGRVVGSIAEPAGVTSAEIARLMCGHEIVPPRRPAVSKGDIVLALEKVSTTGHAGMPLRNVTLAVRRGEILGVAGVSGNGQQALANIIAGTETPTSGIVAIAGRPVTTFSPSAMMSRGVGRIPEDRMTEGLVTSLPLADSLVLPRIADAAFSRNGFVRRDAILAFAERQIRTFDIRCPGPLVRAGSLSGGNLQKALLARELAFDPLVLIAAQPTRGLDIGAAQFVHEQFLALRAKGRGLVIVSEDLEELLALSDRIAVLYEGAVAGILDSRDASVERLGLLMSGVRDAA